MAGHAIKISMESDISDDDIDALLKETGFRSPPALLDPRQLKEESLEKLLDEIMSTTSPPLDNSSPPEGTPSAPVQKDKHKRSRLFLTPIWLSTAILGVFLFGGALGFYWGNTRIGNPAAPSLTSIHTQLTSLIQEVHKLSQWVDPPAPPPEEIIEPLSPPNAMKKLTPEAIL